MNGNRDKYADAVRIFEALASVDEELLERSNVSGKVLPFRKCAKVMAACACFMLVGFVTWYSSRILLPESRFDRVENESCMIADIAGDYIEGAVVEEAVEDAVEEAVEDSYINGLTSLAPMDEVLGEMEVRAIEELGEYVPTGMPEGYVFEYGSRTENGSVYARWSKGMDDIEITVSWYVADEESESRIVDISKPETYDVHMYDIPYVQTVPEAYLQIFDNPIFREKELTEEIVSARIKSVADSGDTDTPRGRFSVLYESGVLVSFNGDCEPQAVWQMFTSIGQ